MVKPGMAAINLGVVAVAIIETILARGFKPLSLAFFALMMRIAEAPVSRPGAFPAVTVGLPYTRGNFASFSRVVSGFGNSSLSKTMGGPFLWEISTPINSSPILNFPSEKALAYFIWLWYAHRS